MVPEFGRVGELAGFLETSGSGYALFRITECGTIKRRTTLAPVTVELVRSVEDPFNLLAIRREHEHSVEQFVNSRRTRDKTVPAA